jgi:hypothetical protein
MRSLDFPQRGGSAKSGKIAQAVRDFELWRSLAKSDNLAKSIGLPVFLIENRALFRKDYFDL